MNDIFLTIEIILLIMQKKKTIARFSNVILFIKNHLLKWNTIFLFFKINLKYPSKKACKGVLIMHKYFQLKLKLKVVNFVIKLVFFLRLQ